MADPKVRIVIEAEDKSKGAFGSAGASVSAFGRQATGAMNDAGASLDSFGGIATGAAEETESAMERAGASLEAFGDKATSAGKTLSVGLTLPLVALGKLAFDAGTKLNAGMADVASLSIASDRVVELKNNVEDMQIQFGKSSEDLTGGLYQVISAFGDGADAVKELDNAIKTGVAGRATTSEALSLISATTKGFGDTSLEAQQHVSDLALKTVELGKTTLPELAGSIGGVTSMSNSLGISQEELFAGASALSGVIGTTSQVFTGQRAVMQSLMAPTENMTGLMKALGFANGEQMVKGLGWSKTLQVITAAQKASGVPLQNFISSIEGQTYAMALTGPLQEKYTSDLEALANATGKTDAAYKAQTTGVNAAGFAMEQAKQKLQVFLERVSDGMGPALLTFMDLLDPVVSRLLDLSKTFAALDPTTQKWIVGIAASAAAVGPLLIAIGSISTAVGAALPVLGGIGTALIGPLGLVAVGAGLLAAAWINDWGGIQEKTQEVLNFLRPGFGELMGWISAASQGDFGPLKEGLQGALQSVNATIQAFKWSDFVVKLGDWGAFVGKLAWSEMFPVLSGWGEYISALDWKAIITTAIDWATWIPALEWTAFVTILDWGAQIATFVWSEWISKIDWSGYVSTFSWTDFIGTLSWIGQLPSLAWSDFIAHLEWTGVVDKVAWDAFVTSLTWDNFVVGLTDWGQWVASLDWTKFITTTIDWATWIPALSWAGFVTALSWTPYIGALAWDAYVGALDWATAVGDGITWSDFVSALSWVGYIETFAWSSFVDHLEWTGTVPTLSWASFVTALSSWGDYIVKLDWGTIGLTAIDWATWIPALSWNSVVGVINWATYLSSLDWGSHVPSINWASYITALSSWGNYIVSLDWGGYITKLADWSGYIGAFAWSSFVSKLDWPAGVSGFSWSNYVEKLGWSSFVTALSDWATWISSLDWARFITNLSDWASFVGQLEWSGFITALSWASYITSFSWSSFITSIDLSSYVPSFPGWSSLVGSVTNLLPGRATGDSSWRGGPTWLGEKGEELIESPNGQWSWAGLAGPEVRNLPAGTRIYNHEDSMKMIADGTAPDLSNIGHNATGTTKAPASGDNALARASAYGAGLASETATKENTKANRELTKAMNAAEKAQKAAIDKLESALQKAPGLFHASDVTQKQLDLAKLGIPQNFADDWIRHLTDEVVNGVQWNDADIKDAAMRAGIDPSLPAKAILDMVKDQWNDSSFFAGGKNTDLINKKAVMDDLAKQQAAASGKDALMALFGIQPDAAQAQAVALGGTLRAGVAQGLASTTVTGATGAVGPNIMTSILGGAGDSVTPEAVAPLAQSFMTAFAAALSGGGKDNKDQKGAIDFGAMLIGALNASLTDSDALASTGQTILRAITDNWKNIKDVDFIGGLVAAMDTQISTTGAIDSLMSFGGKIAKLIKDGIDEYFRTAALADAIANSVTNTTTATPKPLGNNATGTSSWRGGLTWLGEDGQEIIHWPGGQWSVAGVGGPELQNLPAGTRIYNNRDTTRMIGENASGTTTLPSNWGDRDNATATIISTNAQPETPVYINVYPTLERQIDVRQMAKDIAYEAVKEIQRRRN